MASTKDHLTALPVELFVNVAEYLSPRQIARLRAQSRYCRDAIDENQTSLAKGTIEHHRLRLTRDHELLSSIHQRDLFKTLMEVERYYDHLTFCQQKASMVCSTLAIRFSDKQDPFTDRHNALKSQHLIKVAYQFFATVYCLKEYPSIVNLPIEARILHSRILTAGWVAVSLQDVEEKLRTTKDFRGSPRSAADILPAIFLTERKKFDGDVSGRCNEEMKTTAIELGLPDLTMGGFLAYATDEPRILDLIKEASQGTPVSAQLKHVVIIENMRLF